MRHHLTPVRMAKINNSGNNRCWQGCGERGTLLHCWWECKLVQPLWETVWRFLKNLEIELPYEPAIALLGIYPKDKKNDDSKGQMHPNVYSSTITNSQLWKEPKCLLTDEWIKKMFFIHMCVIYMRYIRYMYLAICNYVNGTKVLSC